MRLFNGTSLSKEQLLVIACLNLLTQTTPADASWMGRALGESCRNSNDEDFCLNLAKGMAIAILAVVSVATLGSCLYHCFRHRQNHTNETRALTADNSNINHYGSDDVEMGNRLPQSKS